MHRIFPSVHALRAFDAVARHLSFKKAARELNLSPGAISQKVRNLEDQLGVNLFERTQHKVILTPEGNIYLPGIRRALLEIMDSGHLIRKHKENPRLTVNTLSYFAAKWLIPRLNHFNHLHAKIVVNVNTSSELVDFVNDDVAIRHGMGQYQGLASFRLFSEDLIPVCSPALLKGEHPLRHPQDLQYHTLLHDSLGRDWGFFLRGLNIMEVDADKGPRFNDESLIFQAAIEGQGVALGRSALVAHDIQKGNLVRPFAISMPSAFAYYLVYPEDRVDNPVIAAFQRWLLDISKENCFDNRKYSTG
ncbi:MAG TPA: transcriptional regulator GcvA [Dongiaceae bacterium]|jgi:LysR family glycine cleavage system transcriptional activator|nr:transcriptional regulator GcvA [Dongiaceae bacterium]